MWQAVTGFSTIAVVIAVGYLLAHRRMVGPEAQKALGTVAFYVGQPALVCLAIAHAQLQVLFGWHVAVFGLSALLSGLLFAVWCRRYWRASRAEAVLAYLSTSYVNAGNLGIPLATFILGDPAWAAPAMLLQVLVLQPSAVAVLESSEAGRGRSVLRSFATHPLVLGGLTGLLINLTDWTIPIIALSPLQLLADLAIPTMLLAFGMSLFSNPLPRLAAMPRQTQAAIAVKVAVVPLVALFFGLAVGLSGTALQAAVMLAALPTAQVVFVHSLRYDVNRDLVQATTLWSTLGCIPVIAATLLL